MAMSAAVTIATTFGSKDIAEIVKSFDFSKMDVTDNTKKDYLTVGLAPSFGSLNSESIKKMDDKLKVMIVGTTKLIAKIPPEQRTWENVVSVLVQNPMIQPVDDGIHRSDQLIKKGTNVFKFDGSPDSSIVREVKTWFVKLINDEDVLNSTQIDIEVLSRIVAQTGATIDSFETFFAKHERHSKTMVDIGVLRYPDIDNPYFKIYRIKLEAWSDSSRVLFIQDDSNGITGEFNVRRYGPRDSVIEGMRKESRDNAVKEADDLFS